MNERKCDFSLPYMGKTNPICMHIDTIYLKTTTFKRLFIFMNEAWLKCVS